jgi:hypothetical protein
MIHENIEMHDRYQFELKLGYRISEEEVNTPYHIEMYYFIPSSLDINKETYTKKGFYHDLQTYIRFKSPSVLLRNIGGDGDHTPIAKLRNSCAQLLRRQDDGMAANYIRQIKMFSCVVKSALRDHICFVTQQKIKDDVDSLICEYITLVPRIASEYRNLRPLITAPNISEKLHTYFLFGDEYLSLMIEESAYSLLNYLKKGREEEFARYSSNLYDIIRTEIQHRNTNNYSSIPKENDDNEEIILRKSILKKFMSSVLYLKTMTEKEGVFLEQLLFGIAAGLSMLFATSVAFYSQMRYGTIGVSVFAILVVSYMFKDRIKEILRMYFSKKIQKSLFDHKTTLFTAEKETIGWVKELFYFTKEEKVPQEILQIRNKDHMTEIDNGGMGEKIAVYHGYINLFSKKLIDLYKDYTMEGVNNIMRYDISKFLQKMDNPKKPLFILQEQGHKEIYGKRVYHLNIVIKYTAKGGTDYKHYRIVVNRDGIRRIEELFSEKKAG